MLKLINPWLLAGLLASHGALIGWAGWAEVRVRDARTVLAEQQTQHEQAARQAAEQITALQQQVRQSEQQAAETLAAAADQHRQEAERAQATADSVIADLRAGTMQLRNRLKAARCPGVPGAATPARGGDGADGTGLQSEDAAFLVRESERADRAARRLSLCQATVIEYRRLYGAARP